MRNMAFIKHSITSKWKPDAVFSIVAKYNDYVSKYGKENAINIVINTTKDFSDETKKKAAEYNIILINGTDFASLLVKYGLNFIE